MSLLVWLYNRIVVCFKFESLEIFGTYTINIFTFVRWTVKLLQIKWENEKRY